MLIYIGFIILFLALIHSLFMCDWYEETNPAIYYLGIVLIAAGYLL